MFRDHLARQYRQNEFGPSVYSSIGATVRRCSHHVLYHYARACVLSGLSAQVPSASLRWCTIELRRNICVVRVNVAAYPHLLTADG